MLNRSRLTFLLPALVGASLYLVNLPGTFVYDDLFFAREDPRLGDVRRWGEFLTQEYMDGSADKLWRPLVSLSFAAQAKLHGDHAWPFHLVNLLLHAAVCAMVAALARRLTGSRGVALAAGLLFAAHPIHVEAVSGIVGRAEEMCALGVLGAMLLVVGREMTARRAAAVTGCFLFAALSKEQGILLPFMLGYWFLLARVVPLSPGTPGERVRVRGHVRSDERSWFDQNPPHPNPLPRVQGRGDDLRYLAVMLTLTLAAYISYRNHVAPWFWDKGFLDPTINPLVRSVGPDRWLIPVAILGRYATLMVFPWRLAPDYGAVVFTAHQRYDDPYFYVGAATLVLMTVAAVIAWRRRNTVLLFCLGCMGVTYFLAGNIVLIGTVFGERLMYLPSAFACVLASTALCRLPRRIAVPALVGVLALFCLRTETYAWEWNDRLRFYEYAHRAQPKSAQAFLLLGDELERRGRLAEAERLFAEGRRVCPEAWRLWDMSARLALRRGDYRGAMDMARRTMKLRPSPGAADLMSEIADKMAEGER